MNSEERKNLIVQLLHEKSPRLVNELITNFNVTPATIRRDLNQLEKSGILERSHGAAHLVSTIQVPGFDLRSETFSAEKKAIAQAAINLIKSGDSIILDSGTTTQAIAAKLTGMKNISVVTNSIPIAITLINSDVHTMLTGGSIDNKHLALIGPEAEETFNKVSGSVLFLGTTGIRNSQGLTTFSPFQASIKKKMIESAEKKILVVDYSKFSILGMFLFASFSDIDVLITSQEIENDQLNEHLYKLGVEVIVAKKAD